MKTRHESEYEEYNGSSDSGSEPGLGQGRALAKTITPLTLSQCA